ncbi:hypothetical protein OQH61_08770 [Helicobacter sp. MIT 21-1697]|uniref:hypothetical protein n=1 Tax=Helicobacter sp. MIT 21-1697 TaxID=2993733 RepID=UPI00224ABA5F|nr:hypothetical protein [Helicobacter sp. MIT 21-1697]MCX2717823.1 hypothetical protein [Helicobacter sp. MIT 21-1697]
MKILTRGDIIIMESNLIESSASFKQGEAYTKGDKVNDGKFIYQALSDNVDKPLSEQSVWERCGSTNEWACFDYYLNTQSEAKEEIYLNFSCYGAKALYISGLEAKYLSIEVIDSHTAKVIESKEYKLYGQNIASWSEYFFGHWGRKFKRNIYYECSTFTRNVSFRIRAYGTSIVRIGSIICGDLLELATTLYDGNAISMLDFSKVQTDESGNTQLTKGNFKRTNAFNIIVPDSELDRVGYELAELRGEAVVFVIATNYEVLINFAFLKNHEILLSKVGRSIVSIEIEGLI